MQANRSLLKKVILFASESGIRNDLYIFEFQVFLSILEEKY